MDTNDKIQLSLFHICIIKYKYWKFKKKFLDNLIKVFIIFKNFMGISNFGNLGNYNLGNLELSNLEIIQGRYRTIKYRIRRKLGDLSCKTQVSKVQDHILEFEREFFLSDLLSWPFEQKIFKFRVLSLKFMI